MNRHTHGGRALFWAAALCFGLSGCGTDIPHLLERDAEVTWHAHRMFNLFGEDEPEITAALNRAEDDKLAACADINERARQGTESLEGPFFQRLLTDLSLVLAYLVPLGSVEECADRHRDYRRVYEESLDSLRERDALTKEQMSGR